MGYLIIGAGAAGLSAASTIRKYDPRGKITVLSRESVEPYSLCSLPSYLAGELPRTKLKRFSKSWWNVQNITLKLSAEVIGIKPRAKRVELKGHRPLTFDKLLLATGSQPVIPPVPGTDLEGIFTLNSLDDSNH
ncbi:MAG: FAD-dependent oxidoreductase, partial [Thermoplasmata archaeon]